MTLFSKEEPSELERVQRRNEIFDSAIDFAIIVFDPDGTVTDWNRGAEKTTGWTASEMIGQKVDRFFTPEDRATGRIETEMRLALQDGAANDERWHLRKDGTSFWASGEMMPLRGDDGSHEGFVKIVRDRTTQRNSGEKLRVSEERLRIILDAVETAFAIVEVKFDSEDRPIDYRFLETNPAFEQQSGANLRGKWVSEYAPDLERFWFDTYGRVAATGEPANFENYASTFNRWFDVRAIRVGDPTQRQIAIIFNDTTARRNMEEQRKVLQRELVHRVKNSMAVTSAVVTASMRNAKSLDEARDTIAARIDALSRSQSLISRTEGDADVDEVIREAVAPFITPNVTIFGPSTMISSQQAVGLSLAIYELATNAAKYGALSVPDGKLSITWSTGAENGFSFRWRESRGPSVVAPTRTGFGSRLTNKIVPAYFSGTGETKYHDAGVEYCLNGTAGDSTEQLAFSDLAEARVKRTAD